MITITSVTSFKPLTAKEKNTLEHSTVQIQLVHTIHSEINHNLQSKCMSKPAAYLNLRAFPQDTPNFLPLQL